MRSFVPIIIIVLAALQHPLLAADSPEQNLASYRSELAACRTAHGGSYEVPDVKIFLFGMGARTKLLYRNGILFDVKSGRELHRWKVRREIIVPPGYTISLETEAGTAITLREDSEAVWLEQGGQRTALEGRKSPVKLPDFAGKKFPRVLRVLHQELLVNIVEAGPVTNFFVYEKTDATGKYILGRSDFSDHPVYQTKWLKYGLRLLGLPDPYIIPKVADSYGALFWMDYNDQHVSGKDSDDRGRYPYLGWACDHFYDTKKSPLSNRDYPLTREEHASEASYDGLALISPALVKKRLSPPHTWHAAEVQNHRPHQ